MTDAARLKRLSSYVDYADFGIGIALDVGFQIAGDYGNPYLTGGQKIDRALITAGGSIVSGGVGIVAETGLTSLATWAFGTSPTGWVAGGIALAGIGIAWGADYVIGSSVTPVIYDFLGENQELRLSLLSP